MRVARLFLFADWPEKNFSGQSEGGISNASGTRSVRVSAQGLSRSCCKLSPMKIPSSRLAAPGSPRMTQSQKELNIICALSDHSGCFCHSSSRLVPLQSNILSRERSRLYYHVCLLPHNIRHKLHEEPLTNGI